MGKNYKGNIFIKHLNFLLYILARYKEKYNNFYIIIKYF